MWFMQFCHGIQKDTLHWPLSSLLGSCFPLLGSTLCCFITSRKVHSVTSECQQQQAMLGSPCFGKTFMTFVSFLRGKLPNSLKKLEAYFQFKELFRTRAGVLVWKLPRDIYKMFAKRKGEAKNRRESSGRSKQSLWCVSSINSRESKQTGQSWFSSNKTAICSLDNKHILDIS